jgi:hypothetical protein
MMVVVDGFSNMAHFIPCNKINYYTKVVVLFFSRYYEVTWTSKKYHF